MAHNSKIEWTHHTFNPWWGCTKVSPACKHCYAESWAIRVGQQVWGPRALRRFFNDKHWREPLRWNQEAERLHERRRVFCASMADVFENRRELDLWRQRLWRLIDETHQLDWLLLTKRPENVETLTPWGRHWPHNVWLGTTAEDQEWAERRVPLLLECPAAVRFVSCEPLLGPLNLQRWLSGAHALDWIIAGGESGPQARPMHPEWAIRLRDQCTAAGVAFHFKQWGHWGPDSSSTQGQKRIIHLSNSTGTAVRMVALGKKDAGRDLEGRVWDEVPASAHIETAPDQHD